MNEEAWELGTAEHCGDCVAFASEGWQPLGTFPFPGDGSTQCMTNCQCSKIYRRTPSTPDPNDFIEIADLEDFNSYVNREEYEEWLDTLEYDEEEMLKGYKTGDYRTINRCRSLRDGIETSEIHMMDAAIARAPTLPQNTRVYRGIHAKYASDLKEGDVWSDKGYISTSADKKVASVFSREGAVVEILVRKGQPGLYLEPFAPTPYYEAEILLPRGSKFRILKKEENRILMEYLGA